MCKFYQGGEDKALELRLKMLFAKVHREKPESSRSVRQNLLGARLDMLICIIRSLKKLTSSLCAESQIPRRKQCLGTKHIDTYIC